ncbi:hypothetical protein BKA62DRAFT_610914, partial [Auriculariales sp. MPI-PUGE-AT-0066]
QAGEKLFSLPPAALLTVNALQKLYPMHFQRGKNVSGLSSIQFLVMHLFLHSQSAAPLPMTSDFEPYIASLPSDFSYHPLTWLASPEPTTRLLTRSLPRVIRAAVDAVEARVTQDWNAVLDLLVSVATETFLVISLNCLKNLGQHAILRSPTSGWRAAQPPDFLWAWLCVNTRSVYCRLSAAREEDNIALCPLLDFANHSNVVNVGTCVPSFLAPHSMIAGEEVYLNYGPHPDWKLFVEYGFLTGADGRAELDIGPELEELFLNDTAGVSKRRHLESSGYWGEWTLHLLPTPHPSFRTMSALRCLRLDATSCSTFTKWDKTILGLSDVVDPLNEELSRTTLEGLCTSIISETDVSVDALTRDFRSYSNLKDQVSTVRALWNERKTVASAVLMACRRGDEF